MRHFAFFPLLFVLFQNVGPAAPKAELPAFFQLSFGWGKEAVNKLLGEPGQKDSPTLKGEESWIYTIPEGDRLQVNFGPRKTLISAVIYFKKHLPHRKAVPGDLLLAENHSPPSGHQQPSTRELFHEASGRIWILSLQDDLVEAFMVRSPRKGMAPAKLIGDILSPGSAKSRREEGGVLVKFPVEAVEVIEPDSPEKGGDGKK